MLGTEATRRAGYIDDKAIQRAVVGSIVVALVTGLFLLMRRANGALSAPLSPTMLVATASVLLAWALGVRGLADGRVKLLVAWLPTVVLALFAVACSYPGGRVIDWLVWVLVIAANSVSPQIVKRLARQTKYSSPFTIARDEGPERILQQFTRSRTAEGHDIIRGILVAEFTTGERNVSLHVGFCPPFDKVPEVEAEPVDGPGCTVKVAQVLHQGARIEVRLEGAIDAPHRVTLEFQATADPPLAV